MLSLIEHGGFDAFVVDVSVKAAAILGVAWIISLLLSVYRFSAASRHAVWSLATVSALGLPLMAAVLPTWKFATPWQNDALLTIEAPILEADRGPLFATQMQSAPASLEQTPEASLASSMASMATDEIVVAAESPSNRTQPAAMQLPTLRSIWLTGAALSLAPLCLGLISLWHLRRSSRLVTSGPLFVALQEVKEQLSLNCSVRLLESRRRSMPMTWGIWRPTILLPARAHRWSENRLRIVLLHELAHFQRRDCLMQLLAQIARAAYWFNPLAWLAARQLRALQEQACDDLVLNNGFNAADYAQHVLAVSAGYRSPAYAAGIASAMARPSKLERRVLSILDPNQNRHPLPYGSSKVAIVTTFVALCLVSAISFDATAVGQQVVQTPVAGQAADRAQVLADLRAKIAEQYVTAIDEDEIIQGAMKGMVDALDDPHSGYLTPAMVTEMEKQVSGKVVGIGAQLEMHEGQIRVVTPLENSPALNAGVQPGDIILQIDGTPTTDIELTDAVKRIVGQQGTTVRLNIRRDGEQDLELSITRGPVQVPTVKGFQRGSDNRWSFLLDPTHKIGYIQVSQLGSATPQELRTALESLQAQGMKGLILDLRFCPGGILDSAIAAAKMFLSEGTIVSLQSRNDKPTPVKIDTSNAVGDFPLVVLVNGETASAAEIVAGALQDNQRALVIGSRTVGKGSVQTLIKLDGASGAIRLTTAEYRLPGGRNIDRRPGETSWGIDPDEGYFLPLNQDQNKTLLERRQARDIIGKRSVDGSSPTTDTTADSIENQQADPQLAAALKTMVARITTGQFAKVSNASAAEIELFLKREDVERRRVAVLKDLEVLNRKLADLDKQPSADR